jgi:hypothetical protein
MHDGPQSSQVWQAIDTYLRIAYPGTDKLPASVQGKLDVLRSACGALLKAPAFETDEANPGKYSLRLGNRIFPHMKLVIDCRSAGGCFYRADAHDAHCRPRDASPEMKAYQALIEQNHAISSAIETAWATEGLPTFKTFLRQDLSRRAAATRDAST